MFDFEQMEGNPQRRQRQISEKFQQFPGGLLTLNRMHQVTAFFLNYIPNLTFIFCNYVLVLLNCLPRSSSSVPILSLLYMCVDFSKIVVLCVKQKTYNFFWKKAVHTTVVCSCAGAHVSSQICLEELSLSNHDLKFFFSSTVARTRNPPNLGTISQVQIVAFLEATKFLNISNLSFLRRLSSNRL